MIKPLIFCTIGAPLVGLSAIIVIALLQQREQSKQQDDSDFHIMIPQNVRAFRYAPRFYTTDGSHAEQRKTLEAWLYR